MTADYEDYMTQRAFEDGIKEAQEQWFPSEPPASEQEWWDNLVGSRIDNLPPVVISTGPSYTREEMDQMQRDDVADAMDEQWGRGNY